MMLACQTVAGRIILLVAITLACFPGCRSSEEPEPVVARVDNAELLERDLQAALENIPNALASVEARQQLIDQWVDSELLYQEALRRNIAAQDDVQQRLEESERAVLIDAMVSRLMEESSSEIRQSEIMAYYERHKEQLRLREPFVRVRYLYATDPDSVRTAYDILHQASEADSVFVQLAARFSEDHSMSLSLASSFLPEGRLFTEQPAVAEAVSRLAPGRTANVFTFDDRYHLVQLADRAPTGSIPEIGWVEDVVRRQLAMNSRKQMYKRQIQRLRMEAFARDRLILNEDTTTGAHLPL